MCGQRRSNRNQYKIKDISEVQASYLINKSQGLKTEATVISTFSEARLEGRGGWSQILIRTHFAIGCNVCPHNPGQPTESAKRYIAHGE